MLIIGQERFLQEMTAFVAAFVAQLTKSVRSSLERVRDPMSRGSRKQNAPSSRPEKRIKPASVLIGTFTHLAFFSLLSKPLRISNSYSFKYTV